MDNYTVKIVIESKLAYLPIVRKTIRGFCSTIIEDEKIFQDIELSLNEALSNIIYHAYQNEPNHEIQINVNLYPQEAVFEIVDIGLTNVHGIDVKSPPPLKALDVNAISESGRGIFLLNQLMDEVIYRTEKDRNILILRKRLEGVHKDDRSL